MNLSLLLLDAAELEAARHQIALNCDSFSPSLARLHDQAEDALNQKPVSVMDKKLMPPSGDKHDYMSVGIYWWPNPDTPDGLPYVHRDGQANEDFYASDGGALRDMIEAVETLSAAYFFTREERFAAHAARLLRAWFLDEATRMNPNLNFAQGVPGHSVGRCFGIIDTNRFPYLLDDAMLLAGSPSWTSRDLETLRSWMREYLSWLLTHDFGKEEAAQPNNHATWYDVLVAALARFTGEHEVAQRVLGQVGDKIIARHIEPDGRQPQELKRTRALTYSIVNLLGLFHLATLAEKYEIDLWHFESSDGRSIRRALDFVALYADPSIEWPYREIPPDEHRPYLWMMLRRATTIYGDARYEAILDALPNELLAAERFQLFYPPA